MSILNWDLNIVLKFLVNKVSKMDYSFSEKRNKKKDKKKDKKKHPYKKGGAQRSMNIKSK